jgi:uncharacterized protein
MNIESFLAGSPHAVVGASNDRSKFGNKVLRAYARTGRKVYPVNPTVEMVEGLKCYPNLASLPEKVHGISIITPPKISKQIIKQVGELGVKHIWLQPGAEDEETVELTKDLGMNVIYGGPCILVEFGFHG